MQPCVSNVGRVGRGTTVPSSRAPVGAPCPPPLIAARPVHPPTTLHANGPCEQGCANGVRHPLIATPLPCACHLPWVRPLCAPPLSFPPPSSPPLPRSNLLRLLAPPLS